MNQPPVDGFLSPILNQWSDATRLSMPEWFALVEDLNRTAVGYLPTLAPRRVDRELVGATLYARALQTFEACLIVARIGMLADAGTLARSIAETAFFLGGVACVDDFMDRMAADSNHHFFRLGNATLELKDRSGYPSDEGSEELKALLQDAKGKGHKSKAIDLRQLALEVGMDPLYDTVYRQLSGNAAHPSITSAERHVVRDAQKQIEKLSFSPQREGLEQTFSCAIFALLCAMEATGKVFERQDIQAAVEHFNARHQILAEGLQAI